MIYIDIVCSGCGKNLPVEKARYEFSRKNGRSNFYHKECNRIKFRAKGNTWGGL